MELSQFDYSAAKFWMGLLQLLGLVALGIYTHVTNKSKANASAINTVRKDLESDYDHLEERVVRCERRQDFLEGQQKGAPTHGDLSKMYDRLNDVAEDLSGARGQMSALSHQLTLVNQYLLNNKGDQGR
ncbi:hypothetical protein [Marinobacter salarius]|uniref:hypothetical protein n=1 Tax=Marinobacter salarius TaxID=1420917 RepID=UPI0025A446C4|nr:hypothetical protein [Marinobacter salarius]MDM8181269.1 hypothetical protein [Marinobacter salarius]|tara:strand:- start:786 stop:1172 length:387 start_codon:yes stop_codon:yes gene_type:complete